MRGLFRQRLTCDLEPERYNSRATGSGAECKTSGGLLKRSAVADLPDALCMRFVKLQGTTAIRH